MCSVLSGGMARCELSVCPVAVRSEAVSYSSRTRDRAASTAMKPNTSDSLTYCTIYGLKLDGHVNSRVFSKTKAFDNDTATLELVLPATACTRYTPCGGMWRGAQI